MLGFEKTCRAGTKAGERHSRPIGRQCTQQEQTKFEIALHQLSSYDQDRPARTQTYRRQESQIVKDPENIARRDHRE